MKRTLLVVLAIVLLGLLLYFAARWRRPGRRSDVQTTSPEENAAECC